MALKDRKYKYNQTILKVLGQGSNKKIKVITMNVLRTQGVEDDTEYRSPKGSVNDEKLIENISRTKNKIFELAFCNPWDWFFTGTLRQDRTDLEQFHKQLTQWIRNYNKKYNTSIKFLFIPERHADGISWHIHGFIYGLPIEHLQEFKKGDKMGKGIADKVLKGEKVYNWLDYYNKFGFCDLEPIKNHEAVSKYITKYISKGLATSVKDINAHMYYHSRGLKVAEIKKKGTMLADIAPDFKNEYCSITTLNYSDELYNSIYNSILT